MRKGRSISVYLPPDLYDRLEASAQRNYRTKTTQVILALQEFLAKEEGVSAPQSVEIPPRGRPRKEK